MTKRTLLVALLLACGLSALAQLNSMADPTQPTPMSTGLATDKPQIRGCISRDEAGRGFVLTNQELVNGVPVVSSKDLAGHVGHTVELTGAWKRSAAATTPAGGKTAKTFHASKVRELALKCIAVPKDTDLGIRTSIVSLGP